MRREEFLRYYDLVVYKVYADLRAEASRTYMSYLWWVFDPILNMTVLYIVFGLLFQRGGEGFIAFLLTGIVFWTWYSNTINHSANTIRSGRGLMNQVNVPKVVFPLICTLTDLLKFSVVLFLLLVFLWMSGYAPSMAYLSLPALILVQLVLASGLSFLLAALVPYAPDLKILTSNMLHLQFFLSGIFFSADDIPQQFREIFFANPMAVMIYEERNVLLYATWPDWSRVGIVAALGLALFALAVSIIFRLDKDYPRMMR